MIFPILILATILRIIYSNQSLWLDEAISAVTAMRSFPQQWTGISGDFQPPLFYLFLHIYTKIPLREEWFLRLPSIFFGVATIYVTYKLVRKLINKKAATYAALLMATSQFHIYYSQELRMYSLLCLLATTSMYLFYKRNTLLLSLVHILGFYTSYMYPFILFPQLLWSVYRNKKKHLRSFLISCAVSAGAWLLWVPNFMKQWQTSRNILQQLPAWKNLSSVSLTNLLPQILLKFTLGRISFDNTFLYMAIFIFLTILIFVIVYPLRYKLTESTQFVLNWFATPLIAIIIISFIIPVAGVWRLIFLLPPFLILLAQSLEGYKRKYVFLAILLMVNLFAAILYWSNPKFQREKWREAVKYLDENNGAVVFVVENGFAPYHWYNAKKASVCGPTTLTTCLSERTVYYIAYLEDIFDPQRSIQKTIQSSGFKNITKTDFPGVGFIYKYSVL